MLSLSLSLRDTSQINQVYALFNNRKYSTHLSHPGNGDSRFEIMTYKRYLWAHIHNPFSPVFKDLIRLARLHRNRQDVVLQLHQDARFGDALVDALLFLSKIVKPLTRARHSNQHVPCDLPLSDDHITQIDLHPKRFIWISNATHTEHKLGYVWDTEGVITALVPGYGLIKLGRISGYFWSAVHANRTQFHPRARLAHFSEVSGEVEATFTKLVKRQRKAEQIDKGRKVLNTNTMEFDWISSSALDERYDNEVDHDFGAEIDRYNIAEEIRNETRTRSFLQKVKDPTYIEQERKLLPNKFQAPQVRPVIKRKPNHQTVILTIEAQAQGKLNQYQPLAA